jgi:hypothetical protein
MRWRVLRAAVSVRTAVPVRRGCASELGMLGAASITLYYTTKHMFFKQLGNETSRFVAASLIST